MSDDATPRLSLPYLAAAQAQKHVTLNEALSLLDGLVQTAAESRTTAAQPAAPDDGALYILPSAPTGTDWSGKAEGAVMRFEAGAWSQLPVGAGHVAFVKDEQALVVFDGAAWAELLSDLQDLPMVGVNATADATNRLSVSSTAVLFNHEGAGSQVKVNKAASGDTASHLFQTGFSGRAEFGLTGDDDFTIKVSADGSVWRTAMTVDRNTGKPTFGAGLTLGAGIKFPATQAASSDVNTLDDYEEGTWTPQVIGATTAGAPTYGSQLGAYTKIGRLVAASFAVSTNAAGITPPVGSIRLGPLPFPPTTALNIGGNFAYYKGVTMTGARSELSVSSLGFGSNLALYQSGSGVTHTLVDSSAINFSDFAVVGTVAYNV